MSALKTLADLPDRLNGRRVFVRVDFNAPMQDEQVLDDTRIREALPTIRALIGRGARVVLASHRGRPKGQVRDEFSLQPVAPQVEKALGHSVRFATDCVGDVAQQAVSALGDGDVCLLENLRFHAGEEANESAFVEQLATLTDVYVGDAFGTAHRAHASTAGLPQVVQQAAAGLLMAREAEVLGSLLQDPPGPYAAILGGAKISGKIDTLARLVESIDVLLIGGGMANTFLVAQGHQLGASLVEDDRVDMAEQILSRCAERGVQVALPQDLVTTDDLASDDANVEVARPEASGRFELPSNRLAVDLGPQSAEHYTDLIAAARTLFWNGPMGIFERPPFDQGSRAVAAAVGSCSGMTVIGGGETVAAAALADAVGRIDHVSTGGGASLALLAGKDLPGLLALSK